MQPRSFVSHEVFL